MSVRQFALDAALAASLAIGAGCHPSATVVTTSSAAVGGTIAGVVTGPPDGSLADRTITLVNIETGQRFQTTTGQNGGYSLRVPSGTYRLEVQLREGEELANGNATILLRNGDGNVDGTVDVNTTRQ
jgi:carboxypeptidase family protein